MGQGPAQWLREIVKRGRFSAEDEREIRDRQQAGRLSLVELRTLLLTPLTGPPAAAIRELVIGELRRQPHLAPSILSMHVVESRAPRPEFDYQPGGSDGFRVRCSVRLGQGTVTGEWCAARTKKAAEQDAQVSVLARLAGVTVTTLPDQEHPQAENTVAYHEYTSLDRDRFRAALTEGVGSSNPAADVVDHVVLRARSGLLDPEDLAVVLFAPRQAAWDRARRACLAAANRSPQAASRLIALHPLAAGGTHQRWEVTPPTDQSGCYAATVQLGEDPDVLLVGPVHALGKAAAEHAARLRLLTHLAGITAPAASADADHLLAVSQDTTAVGELHQAEQRGTLSDLDFDLDTSTSPRVCRARCHLGEVRLQARAEGTSKKAAKDAVARVLLLMVNQHLDRLARPSQHSEAPAMDLPDDRADTPSPVASNPGTDRAAAPHADRHAPARPLAEKPSAAVEAVAQTLSQGNDVIFDVDLPVLHAGLLVIDGPRGERGERGGRGAVTRSVLMPGAEVHPMRCRRIGPLDFLTLACSGDQTGWSDSARLWAQAARLALEMIKNGWVLPTIADAEHHAHRQPMWRVGPLPGRAQQEVGAMVDRLRTLPRCLRTVRRHDEVELLESVDMIDAFLDTVAHRFVPTPGARLLLGMVPFAAAVEYRDPLSPLQDWVDAVDDAVDARSRPPHLVLRIDAPQGEQSPTRLDATLLLLAAPEAPDTAVEAVEVWTGRARPPVTDPQLRQRVRQALRRAAATFPPLRLLGTQPRPDKIVLAIGDAVALRGPIGEQLRSLGITVDWHKGWAGRLEVDIAIGTGTPTPDFDGRLGLADVLDRRWRITVDGHPLTDDELDILATAAMPCVRAHNQWVLIDDTVRVALTQRLLPPISRTEGLIALLRGDGMQLEGRSIACSAADGVGYLLDQLYAPASVHDPLDDELDNSILGLYPYQRAAVSWLMRRALFGVNGLLADDMGIGKTATALGFHLHPRRPLRHRPTLVLVPNSDIIRAWRAEIDKRAPHVDVCEYSGSKRTLADVRRSSIVLTTYRLLHSDHAELASRQWGLIIADEAQKIKNPATVTARLARAFPDSLRLPMTGTPMENVPEELWALLDWANCGLVASRSQFASRYGRPLRQPRNDAEAHQARAALREVLTPLMLRRLKDDPALGLKLLPMTETHHTVPMSREQTGLHEALLIDTEDQLALCSDSPRRGELVFKLIVGERKICNSPDHYNHQDPALVAADPAQAAARAPKLAHMHELLRALPADESALVFTNYTRMGELITAYLEAMDYEPRFFHGRAGRRKRRQALEAIGTGATRVLVLTYGSGGHGLTITRPSHVIHYDRHWNPAVEAQANDRVRRIGQHRQINVHHLVTLHSIEERITARSGDKRRLAELVLPNGDLDHTRMSYTELSVLAGLRRRR